ncbi:pilus assembly protein TadG-related protein [Serinicoccus marinus]|uniref:pilus assembly protein TadG-related protein n=1 Tax=Serinicoccus marinus TaxID=247333 RepID=UPI0003B4195B|nr:pilus assembly protein TadG-related protein [Serinicoccus marinus]
MTGTLTEERDGGQISILLIGMVALTLTIIFAVIGVTSVQLSRIQLLDAADAAALDASDALAREQVYEGGLGTGPPVTDQTVIDAASEHLARRVQPSRIEEWGLGSGTGTTDGRTAVVTVTGRASIPVVSSVLEAFGGGVTITVTSSARSEVAG